jgi:RNA polymerase sigma-70 factor (ECF subfamily)
LRITADKHLAENFTKKIFTTAWTEIKNFRKGVNFSVWLKGIAVFTLLNTMDDLKDKPDAGEIKIETGSADTDVLEDKIISLPREERIPFVLHDVEGYSYSEISDLISQLTIDEIKLKVRTARNKIIEGLYR